MSTKTSDPCKLHSHHVSKPWGRRSLPHPFADLASEEPVGELWFEQPDGSPVPLLIKYIFTSERLSVQVHPDDTQARDRGEKNGKTECWYVIDAEPDAVIGVGLTQEVSHETLRAAAIDGSIEQLIDWKPVTPGDFFHVPAGVIHAIGAGIALIEIQQPSDTTFRLYDYGRPRELHLKDGIAVSRPSPYPQKLHKHVSAGSAVLVNSDHFSVLRVEGESPEAAKLIARERMVVPLSGVVRCGDSLAEPGECLLVPANITVCQEAGSHLLCLAGPLS